MSELFWILAAPSTLVSYFASFDDMLVDVVLVISVALLVAEIARGFSGRR